jgi:hypothetical protein
VLITPEVLMVFKLAFYLTFFACLPLLANAKQARQNWLLSMLAYIHKQAFLLSTFGA